MEEKIAFLSYATFDDEHNSGWISRFRTLLSREIVAQTGIPFEIFQYKESISWGEDWNKKILRDLDTRTAFFIAIITPSYLSSENCRKEFEEFHRIERALSRNDLILPIYFTGNSKLENIQDPIIQLVAQRSYVDWRDYRYLSLDSSEMRKRIEVLAKRIGNSIESKTMHKSNLMTPDSEVIIEPSTVRNVYHEEKKDPSPVENKNTNLADEIIFLSRLYRREKPLTLPNLVRFLSEKSFISPLTEADQMESIIKQFMESRCLPGVIFDKGLLYAEEEHFAYKKRAFMNTKQRIAEKAVSFIKSGQVIMLDAGSTSRAIAKRIGSEFISGNLKNLVIITNSIENAHELLKVSNKLGLEEENEYMSLYLIGGRIRINTIACVGDDRIGATHTIDTMKKIFTNIGGIDIAFVGTNGIKIGYGFTTAKESEYLTKKTILEYAKEKYIVTDPSKFGLKQARVFAGFDESIHIITSKDIDYRYILEEYEDYLEETSTTIKFV